jgi:hypothetical protein
MIFDLKGTRVAQGEYGFKLKISEVGWAEKDANERLKGLLVAARDAVGRDLDSGYEVRGIGLLPNSASVVSIGINQQPLADAIM